MPIDSSKLIIEQIYNFIIEKPQIRYQSKFMQLAIFFGELHEVHKKDFQATKPFIYKGVFNGETRKISALGAPEFFDK